MKYTILFLALSISLLVGCTKEKKDNPEYTFQILEYNTSFTPVVGAKVEGYKCLKRDGVLGGCLNDALVSTVTTDANGNVKFYASDEVAILRVSKPGYWFKENYFSFFLDNSITLLEPIATLKIHFIKASNYASNNNLYIMTNTGKCWQCKVEELKLGQPVDTTIYLKALGNDVNPIESFMWDGITRIDVPSTPVKINHFDTARVEIRY